MARKHVHSTKQPGEAARSKKQKKRKRSLTWLWVGLAALLIVGVGIFLLASQTAGITALSPAQTQAKIQQGAFLLDVRTQDEYNQSHLKGSMLIPLDQLSEQLDKLPRDKDIVVICHSGARSLSAAVLLQQKGFKRVSYLEGGLIAWQAAGYPLQAGNP
ncbi:MAG TPA: rhodanese-like domain-containing protein [Anaerolineales bacterium]|nr:rhodanese-like domain-containing protein [Anaerolineales bacterium]